MYDLEQLIEGARDYLCANMHSRSSIAHHEAAWKRLRAWCEGRGLDGFDHEVERRYLEESGLMRDDLPRHVRTERGYVRLLLSIAETGAPPERTFKSRYVVPPAFEAAYEAYAAELAARGNRPRTQAGYLCTVRNFCANCGASGPEGLDALSIGGFVIKPLRWPPMVLKILWCTGMRIGEVAALTVGDFHRDARSLFVAHAKNDRSRIIPVSESLAGDLGDYIDAHVPGGDSCRWLFPGKDPGTHRSKKAIGNRLRGIYREAGVLTDAGRPIRTHDIRHSFAIAALERMVEQGRVRFEGVEGHPLVDKGDFYIAFIRFRRDSNRDISSRFAVGELGDVARNLVDDHDQACLGARRAPELLQAALGELYRPRNAPERGWKRRLKRSAMRLVRVRRRFRQERFPSF